MNSRLTNRESGIDLLKIVAMVSVLGIHYFLYSGFYDMPKQGHTGYLILGMFFRTIAYQCVPLFLMITGYLKRNATFTLRHYVKLIPFLVSALLVGVIVVAYKILYLKEHFAFLAWLRSLWMFTQPSYAWYVNAYVSLYLLIPFINAGYHALKTKRQKFIAVLIVLFVTMFVRSFDKIPMDSLPITSTGLFPSYLACLWPVGYYVIGMHIGDIKPKVPKWIAGSCLVGLCMLSALLCLVTCKKTVGEGVNFTNEDIVTCLIASCEFLLLYDLKLHSPKIKQVLRKIAATSGVFFLLSYIGDNYLYFHRFFGKFNWSEIAFPLSWLVLPVNFLSCLIVSLLIEELVERASKQIQRVFVK